jgi:hypothetical protein
MTRQVYTIYSHDDADGGISAAMYGRFVEESFGRFGWTVEVTPVNHFPLDADWSYQQITAPCAILDFNLHAQFLNPRFFQRQTGWHKRLGDAAKVPASAWIDHHPTGATFAFLNAANARDAIPNATVLWDTNAVSTPGLLRAHYQELGIPRRLIEEYEGYIDLAEIVDGALYATPEEAHNFENPAVKIRTLFSCTHPAINTVALYKQVVDSIMRHPDPEELFDLDPIFNLTVRYEESLHHKRVHAYRNATRLFGRVAVSNFTDAAGFAGLSRFLPHLLFPRAEYAIHVLPRHHGFATITAGINPWNKPTTEQRHLGNFFAEHFSGGGHSFVGGGKISEDGERLLNLLIDFLNH